MKLISTPPLITAITVLSILATTAHAKKPEEQAGYDKTKDLGVKAPEGADVPFDGTMESVQKNWEMWPKKDMEITWQIMDSPTGDGKTLMPNGGKKWGTHDLVTKKKYHDFEGHVEFVLMGARGDDKAEGYANSGVYMQNRHELQIESPKGKNIKNPYGWKIGPHGIGAVCMEHVPKGNAWRPNGEWHSFHFIFRAADWEGKELKNPARLTLWWNGIKVHDNVPVKHANGGVKNGPSDEPLKLQEHGQDVRFRNIWIKELK
ncbi:MAG: 3-keto-disaccharide hydrolase [Akkermansiaceae bacterium]